MPKESTYNLNEMLELIKNAENLNHLQLIRDQAMSDIYCYSGYELEILGTAIVYMIKHLGGTIDRSIKINFE